MPCARLCFVRLAALLSALLALAPLSARAETLPTVPSPPSGIERTRVQRAMSDDPLLDQYLAAPTAGELRAAWIGQIRPLSAIFVPVWPSPGVITTYFGDVSPLSPRGHSGIDVAGPQGTPIDAADAGEVVKANFSDEGYGNLVIVAHASGFETWYGHLSRIDVSKGQQVRRGQEIGLMGSTGLSTGSHLHFEVRQEGQIVDPLRFLSERVLQRIKDWT